MAEQVVTSFVLDTSGFDAKIESAAQEVEGYSKAVNDAQKGTQNLGASMGSAAGKQKVMAQTLGDIRKQIDDLNRKKLTLSDPKQIAQVNAQLDRLKGKYKDLDTATLESTKKTGGLFNRIGTGAKEAATAIPGVGGLFTALTGTVTLAAGAVVGLIANLTRLDSVATFVDGLKFTFDALAQRLTSIEGIKSLFDPQTYARDYASGQALAEMLDELDQKQRDINRSNAEADKELASLNQRLRDRTKTEQERLAIADAITAKETDRADKEEQYLKERLQAVNAEIAARRMQGTAEDEIADELLDRQNEAQIALTKAQTDRISLLENVERRRNSIEEQGATERAALAAKEEARQKAAAEKARAQAEKVANDRIALERDLAKAINDARTGEEKEIGEAGVTRDDRVAKAHGDAELLAKIEEQYQQDVQAIRDRYATERMKKQDELDAAVLARRQALAQQEFEALASEHEMQIAEAAMNGEDLNALLASQAEERLALIEGIRDREIEAKLTEFDAQYAAAEEAGLDLVELTEIQQEEINAIRQRYREEDQEAADEATKKALEAEQEAQEQRLALVSLGAETAGNIAGLIEAAAGDNEAAAQTALALQKASAIANAIVSASTARMGAVAGAAANPVIAAGGPAAIAAFAAPTIGLINANLAISIATILAQGITANYEGDPYVGGKPDLNTSRDAYIRRVHLGERIVTAATNEKHFDALEAMEEGTFDKWMKDHSPFPEIETAMALNFGPALGGYLDSEKGQRDGMSIMFPHAFDRNIVEGSKAQQRELRGTREDIQHLTTVIERGQRRTSKRYRA